MARWIDIRVERRDWSATVQRLTTTHGKLNFSVDFNPSAAGPEVEVQVEAKDDMTLRSVEGLLRGWVPVLAIRQRLDRPQEAVVAPERLESM